MKASIAKLCAGALLVIATASCHPFPRIVVNYSGLGDSPLDRNLVDHWPSGEKYVRAGVENLIRVNSDSTKGVTPEELAKLGAICSDLTPYRCKYNGVIRYRLEGTLSDARQWTVESYHIDILIQDQKAQVTVSRETTHE